jgi:hypothetical protein
MTFLPSGVAPYRATQLEEFEKRLDRRAAASPSAGEVRALLAAVELHPEGNALIKRRPPGLWKASRNP